MAWTEWQDVEGEYSTAIEGVAKVSGVPAPTDGARYAQYRIAMSATGPGLPGIRGTSLFALDSATTRPRAEVSLQLAPRDRALATIKPLGIVSRKQWGADESLRFESSSGEPRGTVRTIAQT